MVEQAPLGYDAFEALLAEHEAEYFDLQRESLV
jgi:hypothetical protein